MKRFVLLGLLVGALSCSQRGCTHAENSELSTSPRLVTLVVVSGLRGDEIQRFKPLWRYGFKTLLEQGHHYSKAIYRRGRTDSASGQATLGTGVSPKNHGIINDHLFYPSQNRLLKVCGIWKSFCGARVLTHPTLGERLKKTSPGSKVVVLGGSRQFTELIAANSSDLSLWFSPTDFGLKAKSGSKEADLPAWIERYFETVASPDRISRIWELPAVPPPFSAWRDFRAGEWDGGHGVIFPHQLAETDRSLLWEQWHRTPDADRAIADLGSQLVSKLNLGDDEVVDYFVIGFSALGMIGEDYGPYSLERVSALMELDRVIGDFLQGLEEATGKTTLVGLTADHGVAPLPEGAMKQNKKGARVLSQDIVKHLDETMLQRFGTSDYLQAINFPFLHLKTISSVPKSEVVQVAVNALGEHPAVYKAWATDAIEKDSDPIAGAMAESIVPGKSGDIAVVLRPYQMLSRAGREGSGSSNGSPWHYDRHVPVFLWGSQVSPGTTSLEVSVIDLLRTLGDELGLLVDSDGGNPLPDAFKN